MARKSSVMRINRGPVNRSNWSDYVRSALPRLTQIHAIWRALPKRTRIQQGDAMTIRVAAIEVSHWHALHDAAYLRHLIAMPDVELVAIQDSDVSLVARRAAEVGSPPTFTDYRQMLATTRPDFVVALGRQSPTTCSIRAIPS
jgi:hypothetical protein